MKKFFSVQPRSDVPTIFLHWFLAFVLIVSLATGLRISADSPDAVWSPKLSEMLPQGAVMSWHLYSAYGLSLGAIAYVLFLWRAGGAPRVRPSVRALTALQPGVRWRGINRALYWVAFVCIAVEGITGTMLYFAPRASARAIRHSDSSFRR